MEKLVQSHKLIKNEITTLSSFNGLQTLGKLAHDVSLVWPTRVRDLGSMLSPLAMLLTGLYCLSDGAYP